jgi:hypothetical protein
VQDLRLCFSDPTAGLLKLFWRSWCPKWIDWLIDWSHFALLACWCSSLTKFAASLRHPLGCVSCACGSFQGVAHPPGTVFH